jgi:hypothetical protein
MFNRSSEPVPITPAHFKRKITLTRRIRRRLSKTATGAYILAKFKIVRNVIQNVTVISIIFLALLGVSTAGMSIVIDYLIVNLNHGMSLKIHDH